MKLLSFKHGSRAGYGVYDGEGLIAPLDAAPDLKSFLALDPAVRAAEMRHAHGTR